MLEYTGIPGWTKLNGKAIGLGGDVTIKGIPPYSDKLIKAATQEELQILKDRGNKKIVETKKRRTQNVVELTESNTGSDNRSETGADDPQAT